MLHLDDRDLDGVKALSIGNRITLRVTGKVVELREEEIGDEEKARRTNVTLRLSEITRASETSSYTMPPKTPPTPQSSLTRSRRRSGFGGSATTRVYGAWRSFTVLTHG